MGVCQVKEEMQADEEIVLEMVEKPEEPLEETQEQVLPPKDIYQELEKFNEIARGIESPVESVNEIARNKEFNYSELGEISDQLELKEQKEIEASAKYYGFWNPKTDLPEGIGVQYYQMPSTPTRIFKYTTQHSGMASKMNNF